MQTRIEIILGPMYSGKSTELIRRVSRYRYRETRNRIIIINHSSDKRPSSIDGTINGNSVQTHCGRRHDAIKTDCLMSVLEEARDHDVIGIDEAQFFPDLYDFVLELEQLNKVIIVAGLDGDSNRRPFGQILQLIPLCDGGDGLVKLTAMATDGSPASFTKRLVKSTDQILVGATESYAAVSREGYFS